MNIGELIGLDINIPTWILVVVGLFIPYYVSYTWKFNTFDKLGIRSHKPWIPFVNMIFFMQKGMYKSFKLLYQSAKKAKCIGSFGPEPILNVADLDMIREILVKQFHCFQNRIKFTKTFPMDRILSHLDDDHWKHVRNTLTPTFSASKIKNMIRPLNECADELLDKLEEIRQSGSDFHPKDTTSLFSYDAIAKTAFGLNIHALKDPNSEFVTEAQKFSDAFSAKNQLFLFMVFAPIVKQVMEYFNIGLVSQSAGNFFRNVIDTTVDKREENGMVQSDFLQLLLSRRVDPEAEKKAKDGDLQKGDFKTGSAGLWSTTGLTDDDVFASAFIFLFAGFDTVATALGTTLYCLAANSECQEKLVKEIDDIIGDKEDVEYDDVFSNLPYLDNCFNESMRMYPVAPRIDRVCTEECVIEGIRIPKGMEVGIPVVGLHYDEEYWSNPDVFDPERFNPDIKATRNPYVFHPFGHGPRNCIGMRLALVEVKVAIIKIVRRFKLVPSEKTQVPLPMKSFSVKDEAGLTIKLETRT